MKPTIRFNLALSQTIALPKNLSKKLPSSGSIMAEGTVNAFPFQASIVATKTGAHQLNINASTCKGAGAAEGASVPVEILRLEGEPETRVPAELTKALKTNPKAQAMWDDTTAIARRDWVLWISTAKLAETRQRRVEGAIDRLASGKRRICCFPGAKWLMKNPPNARRAAKK